MAKGVFILGTDTGVGKTVVAGGMVYLLRSKGYNACYFKPVLSGATKQRGKANSGRYSICKGCIGVKRR
jgi:dethiobiotin synthetase